MSGRMRMLCLGIFLAAPLMQARAGDIGWASFYDDVPDRSQLHTAAHRTLPFGTMVSVMRLDTGDNVVVRINDRGPFIRGRVIDLSRAAAKKLGIVGVGVAKVSVQVIPAPVPVPLSMKTRSR